MTPRPSGETSGPIAVVGGGPAGLGAAYGLVQRGRVPVVFEAAPEVGGLARSIELWGVHVDLGAHLLQRRNPRIDRLWEELIGPAYDAVPRRTAVLIGSRRFQYPYEPLDVARGLGPVATARCVASFVGRRRSRASAEGDLEQWVVARFGRRLFDVFVRDYAEKLFGLPASEIDGAFASTLIGFQEHGSLAHAVRTRLRPRHRPAVRVLVRPHGGVGALMERIATLVRRSGAIRCEEPVRRLRSAGDAAVRVETDRGSESFAHVIVTLPLPIAVPRLTSAPPELASRLREMRSRNVLVVYLLVEAPRLFREQWLYLHSPTLAVGRIANFANWKPTDGGSLKPSILAGEIWCDEADDVWTETTAELVSRIVDELGDVGLLAGAGVLDAHIERIRGALPVLRCGDMTTLNSAASYANGLPNVTFTSQPESAVNPGVHGSLLQGLDAADSVAGSLEARR